MMVVRAGMIVKSGGGDSNDGGGVDSNGEYSLIMVIVREKLIAVIL